MGLKDNFFWCQKEQCPYEAIHISDLLAWAKQEYADALEFYEKSNPDRITQGKVMALGKLIKELEGG